MVGLRLNSPNPEKIRWLAKHHQSQQELGQANTNAFSHHATMRATAGCAPWRCNRGNEAANETESSLRIRRSSSANGRTDV